MSYSNKQNVECSCGKEFEWDLWDSINVTTDPDLKEMMLNGLLNVVVCPYCGLLFYWERFLLYHDEKKRYLFYVYNHDCKDNRDELREKAKIDYETVKQKSDNMFLADYKIEVFFGLDELVEFIKNEEEL
ncbi:MAG: CpXC domain-containing protein [Elusimicrobia bacterium]|nr:CpXC domain-containing protein [Elusimicrobiota bacterium]